MWSVLRFAFRPDLAVGGALAGWLAGGLVGDEDAGWRPRGLLGWGTVIVALAAIVAWALVAMTRAGALRKGSVLYEMGTAVSDVARKVVDAVLGLVRPLLDLLPGVAL